MLRFKDIYNNELDGKSLISTSIRLNKEILLIEESDLSLKQTMYQNIYKFNIEKKSVNKYEFNSPINLLSRESIDFNIFWGHIYKKESTYHIDTTNLDCKDWSEISQTTINTGIGIQDNNDVINRFLGSEIWGINKRFSILMLIKDISDKMNQKTDFYQKIFLIDSYEKKTCEINGLIGKKDSLKRSHEKRIFKYNDRTYLVLKTGRIYAHEKEMIWKSNNVKKHQDSLENLVLVEVEDFVNKSKRRVGIDEESIIDTCDKTGALNIIAIENENIIYQKKCFTTGEIEIRLYDLNKNKIKVLYKTLKYKYLLYSEGKIFGIIIENNQIHLYDLNKNKLVFKTTEIIHSIKKSMILTENNDNLFSIYDINNNLQRYEDSKKGKLLSIENEEILLI